MPLAVCDALLELLAELEFARSPSAEVRLMSGTTVSLLDRVAGGAFSDRLFYRLNIIHVRVGDARAEPDAAVGHAQLGGPLISMRNMPGKGCVFIIDVPLAAAETFDPHAVV